MIPYKETIMYAKKTISKERLIEALNSRNCNVEKVAMDLGVGISTVYRWIRLYDLKVRKEISTDG